MQAHPQNFDLSKIWQIFCLISKMGPTFAEKHMKTFFEVIPKKVFMIFVGGNLYAKSRKNFSGRLEEIRAKILRTPKSLPVPTLG